MSELKLKPLSIGHQGDVLIINWPEDVEVPKGEEVKAQQQAKVVQHGEALGHYHQFTGVDAQNVNLIVTSPKDSVIKQMFCVVKKPVTLTHPEHGAISFSDTKCKTEMKTQREWLQGLEKQVID